MDEKLIDEIIDAVLPPIEAAESQTAALIHLMRERGLLNEDDFARFQEQAENASEIKSRALRLRLHRILTAATAEIDKLKKQVDDLYKQKAEDAANPEHRDRKEGPPTKEEAARDEKPQQRAGEQAPERPREESREQKPKEVPKKQEAPAAGAEAEQQEPQKKAS